VHPAVNHNSSAYPPSMTNNHHYSMNFNGDTLNLNALSRKPNGTFQVVVLYWISKTLIKLGACARVSIKSGSFYN
jgi:chloramphenicol O-acetyltransferase